MVGGRIELCEVSLRTLDIFGSSRKAFGTSPTSLLASLAAAFFAALFFCILSYFYIFSSFLLPQRDLRLERSDEHFSHGFRTAAVLQGSVPLCCHILEALDRGLLACPRAGLSFELSGILHEIGHFSFQLSNNSSCPCQLGSLPPGLLLCDLLFEILANTLVFLHGFFIVCRGRLSFSEVDFENVVSLLGSFRCVDDLFVVLRLKILDTLVLCFFSSGSI